MRRASRARGDARVGTSGWQYRHWRGVFYPDDLRPAEWFEHYAGRFDTVEVNNTFYRLPEAATFAAWRRQAPPGFLYAVKFNRFGSHMKKLLDPEQTVGRFLERALELEHTLGPVLVHLPPRWKVQVDRLARFLDVATSGEGRRVRWAVELRDPSWLCAPVYRVLRERDVALCLHDMLPNHPDLTTAGWTYLRFHGGRWYDGAYDDAALAEAARRVEAHRARGRDVYVYFNNDLHGHAVRNAADLRARLRPRRRAARR
ncbi:MAG: DUF72 domain-containing protein [Planctomycetota bacterium]|nr:DUF72 domain-containing protein [Planctomycetota bacterium]